MDALMTYLNVWGLNDWDPWTFLTILLMACVTVITRCFFFIADAPWTLPSWAQRGMQYAPIAALAAVVLPEIVMTQGVFIHSLADARIFNPSHNVKSIISKSKKHNKFSQFSALFDPVYRTKFRTFVGVLAQSP